MRPTFRTTAATIAFICMTAPAAHAADTVAAAPAATTAPAPDAALQQTLAMQIPAAAKGDVKAMIAVGRAYAAANHPAEAEQWLTRAANTGDATAEMELARFYLDAFPADATKAKQAASLTQRAADKGDPNAQIALALLYQKGQGVPKDDAKAAAIFEKLANQGFPGAQYNLGVMYRDGIGVPKDASKAAAWLSLAVQGYPTGPARDRIVAELQAVRSTLTPEEKKAAESYYTDRVSYFHGEITKVRPDLPSGSAVEPKAAAAEKAGFSGFVQFGARWQSNASGAPSAYEINNSESGAQRPRPDLNLFALGNVNHLTKRINDRIDNIDTRVVAYQTRQNNRTNSDLGFLEVSTGPNVRISTDGNYSVRPYVIGNMIQVNETGYSAAGGAGVTFINALTHDLAVVATAEDTYTGYHNTSAFPDNDESSGNQAYYALRGLYRIQPWLTTDLGFSWRDIDADKAWESQKSGRITNGYSVRLPVLFPKMSDRKASLYGSISYKKSWYGAPDANVAPGITRADKEWQWTLTGEFPVFRDWSLVPTVQRSGRDANAKPYVSYNSQGSLAMMYKF